MRGKRGTQRSVVALALFFASADEARALSIFSTDTAQLDVGGDIKTFAAGIFPYEHPLVPSDPQGRGLLDLRLKLDASVGDWLRVTFHPNVYGVFGSLGGTSGAGATARLSAQPEAIVLSRQLIDSNGLSVNARIDRAAVTVRFPHLDITAGRQPISFGSTFFFTPLDIVAPFNPLIIDREYKPGVDALRADAFVGTSNKLTVVAAYAGSWDLDGVVLAGRSGTTVWLFDIGVFAASVHKQVVVGVDTAGEIFGFAVRSEATLSVPPGGARPYLRAAFGMDRQFENGLMVMGEVYVQTIGAARPEDYYDVAQRPEFSRGEIWALGRYYGALSASYELLPVMNVGVSSVVNFGDRSALLGPSLTWSLGDDAVLVAGAFTTLGERPAKELSNDPARPLQLRSEFGTAPTNAYLQFKAYF